MAMLTVCALVLQSVALAWHYPELYLDMLGSQVFSFSRVTEREQCPPCTSLLTALGCCRRLHSLLINAASCFAPPFDVPHEWTTALTQLSSLQLQVKC